MRSTNANKVIAESIPEALRRQPWAVWNAEPRPDQPGKFNKAPRSPLTLVKVGANNPAAFGTFEQAYATYAARDCSGIGVLMTGNGIVGVDIDNYKPLIEKAPAIKNWVKAAIERKIYCEKSPSGEGLRLFLLGSLPNGVKGRKYAGLEIYADERFLTVTGRTYKREGARVSHTELFEAQDLIDGFLELLPNKESTTGDSAYRSTRAGPVPINEIPTQIREKVPELLMPRADVLPSKFRDLYEGSLRYHNHDHSAADLALVGLAHARGLTATEIDLLFRSSKLYRPKWDEMRGGRTYGELTISMALANANQKKAPLDSKLRRLAQPDAYIPTYHPHGMAPRQFAGPSLDSGSKLMPLAGLSTLAGLGATGKTTVMLSICAHIAAGRPWNGCAVVSRKVVFAAVEETKDELNRKFSAVVDTWEEEYRLLAEQNMRLIPLQGVDARLTQANGRQIEASDWADELVEFCRQFGLKDGVIVLDHLQGLATGDLNSSETATAVCRAANHVAAETGSAVVMLSHTSKANMQTSSSGVAQGFVSGSLAFENAMRQTMVLVRMTAEEAKQYGITEGLEDYIWLGIPKNSYGKADTGMWLKKTFSPKFHSVTIEPVSLSRPIKESIKSAQDRLVEEVCTYVQQNPYSSRNAIEKKAGVNGKFKTSARNLRSAISAAISSGRLELRPVTASDRAAYSVSKQVKEALHVNT